MSEREGWIEWGGHRTWFRIAGDLGSGLDPLLCLHGGPGSTHHYFAPLERLTADGRAVVLYDQLGCGRSDRPDSSTGASQIFLDELAALREQLGLERVHLLGTSWGGMLALEHALSGFGGLTSLVLSSTLASAAEWEVEVKRLRDELPPDVVAVFDEHERAGTYDSPEYEAADAVMSARHFYRGDDTPAGDRAMLPERGRESYRAMWGPNEWTLTGALQGWDVRPRLHELDLPALVIRGRYDLSTESIAATLVNGLPQAREVVFEQARTPRCSKRRSATSKSSGASSARPSTRAEIRCALHGGSKVSSRPALCAGSASVPSDERTASAARSTNAPFDWLDVHSDFREEALARPEQEGRAEWIGLGTGRSEALKRVRGVSSMGKRDARTQRLEERFGESIVAPRGEQQRSSEVQLDQALAAEILHLPLEIQRLLEESDCASPLLPFEIHVGQVVESERKWAWVADFSVQGSGSFLERERELTGVTRGRVVREARQRAGDLVLVAGCPASRRCSCEYRSAASRSPCRRAMYEAPPSARIRTAGSTSGADAAASSQRRPSARWPPTPEKSQSATAQSASWARSCTARWRNASRTFA